MGERILAIPGLSEHVTRIFKEARPAFNRINGVRLDLIDWEDHFSEEDIPPYLKSLYTPTLQQILQEVGAEVRANQYVMTYRGINSSFQPVRWSIMDDLVALFPDFPRLAMNIGTKPANSISTGHSKGSAPTVEDILARKNSKVNSLSIVNLVQQTDGLTPEQIQELSAEWGHTI